MSSHYVSLIECLCVVTHGGQTRRGRANRGDGDKQCGGTNMGFEQAGGGDKRGGVSVSEANRFASEASNFPAVKEAPRRG